MSVHAHLDLAMEVEEWRAERVHPIERDVGELAVARGFGWVKLAVCPATDADVHAWELALHEASLETEGRQKRNIMVRDYERTGVSSSGGKCHITGEYALRCSSSANAWKAFSTPTNSVR